MQDTKSQTLQGETYFRGRMHPVKVAYDHAQHFEKDLVRLTPGPSKNSWVPCVDSYNQPFTPFQKKMVEYFCSRDTGTGPTLEKSLRGSLTPSSLEPTASANAARGGHYSDERVARSTPNQNGPPHTGGTGNKYVPNNVCKDIDAYSPCTSLKAPRSKGPTYPGPVAKGRPSQKKALLIGINGTNYPGGPPPLNFAVKDAKRFKGCLIELGFESDSIKSLTDEGGKCISQPNIFAGLRWLFDGAGSDDLLVLFISGHCSLNEVNQVVSLVLSQEDRRCLLVPSTVFSSHFNKLPAGCTVEVVLDCCYSGGLVKLPHVIKEMENRGRPVNLFNSTPTDPVVVEDSTIVGEGFTSESRETKLQTSVTVPSKRGSHITHGAISPLPHDSARVASTKGPGAPNTCTPPGHYSVRDGPRPNNVIETKADVTVWAASKSNERAYESTRGQNGILTNAMCNVIEAGERVRQAIWNAIKQDTELENDKLGVKLAQHSQILSSRNDPTEIMGAEAFRRPLRG